MSYIEITLISNNSSFIAKKSKTWDEERVVAEKAPVDGIVINDLNEKIKKRKLNQKNFHILLKLQIFIIKKLHLKW